MTIPFSGGCVCGAVRYECAAQPLAMLLCHCRDCQRVSGSAYLPIVIVPLHALKLDADALQRFATARLSGRPNLRSFCAKCGSSLTVGEDEKRDLIGLTASSLNDPSFFQPSANIFVCDAQPWAKTALDLPRHEQYLPRD